MDNSEGNPPVPPDIVPPPAPAAPQQADGKLRTDVEKVVDVAQNFKIPKAAITIAKIIHEEREGLKKCKVAISLIALVVGCAVWWGTSFFKNRSYAKVAGDLQTTQGKLQQSKEDNDKLRQANQDATTKYNEQLREKDTEITRLTNEKGTLETKVTMLEAIPDRITSTASNAIVAVNNGLTNWQQNVAIVDSIRSLTNDLAILRSTPMFILRVNGTILSNLTVIPFPSDGILAIRIENVGLATADSVCLDFGTTVAATNFVSDGWIEQPKGIVSGKPAEYRVWTADHPIAMSTPSTSVMYSAASIKFSTNVLSELAFCYMGVYAKNARTQGSYFLLCPSNQVEAATAWLRGPP